MYTYTLPEKDLTLWRIWLVLVYLLLMFLCGVLLAFIPIAGCIAMAGVLAAGAAAWFWYFPQLRKSYRVTLSEKAVVLTRGVIFRQEYLLPCPRLIYVERFSTPLSALLGLQGLRLRAARGRLTISCLSREDAADFLERLHELSHPS